MAAKSLKEAAILVGALYAWCTVGGNVCGYCIGTAINFAKPFHPIPSYSSMKEMPMGNLRKSYVNKQLTMDDNHDCNK